MRVDTTRAEKKINRMVSKIERGAQQGLNRAARGAQTDWSRLIRNDLNVKAGDVKRRLSLKQARNGELVAVITLTGKANERGGTFLSVYAPLKHRHGITIRVKKGGGRKLVRGAFLATLSSGHVGVFRRARKGDAASRRKRVPRQEIRVSPRSGKRYLSELPIDEAFSTSVVQVGGDTKVELIDLVKVRARKEITRAVLNQLRR